MTETQTLTPEIVADRFAGADRPLFKGKLIDGGDDDVCYCAQGWILHWSGWSDDRLRSVEQKEADEAVAKQLGISTAHSILLRQVNDSKEGCPQDVLTAPEKVLGDQAHRVLAFWRRLDAMTPDDWKKVIDARYAAGGAARYAAGDAARYAAWASNEIQGAAVLKEQGRTPFFLPMFGINDLTELDQ